MNIHDHAKTIRPHLILHRLLPYLGIHGPPGDLQNFVGPGFPKPLGPYLVQSEIFKINWLGSDP